VARARRGNLSAQLNAFIGRRGELAQLRRAMESHRVVTIIGTGGVGKSRTAQRVAQDVSGAFPDGVWLVELDELADGPLLPSTVLVGLGLRDDGGTPVAERLIEHFRSCRALLLLDGCDQVVDACAELVDALLRAAPDLRVLVTSRRPLRVAGEAVIPLGPLSLPPSDRSPGSAALLEHYDATALFLDRALTVAPGLVVDTTTAAVLARICLRLDGLPLAIELAADRLDVLSPEELADRLDDVDRLLVAGKRGVPERQRSVGALVESSARLCTPAEQALWARLSVFVGSFQLEAVERVCAGGPIHRDDVLDLVAGLIDKSILSREDRAGSSWYRLPRLLREYAERRLLDSGDYEAFRAAHARWCVSLAEDAAPGLLTSRWAVWLEQVRGNHANIRHALECCLDRPALAQDALRLAGALWFYWIMAGRVAEGRAWLDRSIRADPSPSRERAFALAAATYLAIIDDADDLEDLLALARQHEDVLDDPVLTGHLRFVEGLLDFHRGVLDSAATRLLGAWRTLRGAGDLMGSSRSLGLLALVCALDGNTADGLNYCEEFLSATETAGDNWGRAYIHVDLALLRVTTSDPEGALAALRLGAGLLQRLDDRFGMGWVVHTAAVVFALTGAFRESALMLGAGLGHRASARGVIDDLRRRAENQARPALGTPAFDELFEEGRTMSLLAAVRLAAGASPAPEPVVEPQRGLLSRREWEVAELVADGRSNKEIAAALVISQRTAEGHVQRILGKLGFLSRAQIAAWATEQRVLMRQDAARRLAAG